MAQVCTSCGNEAAADARFCPACGAPFAMPAGAERKLATMVFVDLVESTQLAAASDPEELRGHLSSFFTLARSTLEEHGGTVEKYIGDAVMAVFGVPQAHSDDPDRAVSASLALVERLAEGGGKLAVRVGVETGEVLATGSDGDLAVTGDAVNAAARLQAAAAAGQVLVGERAARSCRSATLEPGAAVDAKGFAVPLKTWRAVAGGTHRPQTETAFVGREDDLALLRIIYRRAVRERIPELITITGEAGIGKTRLATELVGALADDDATPTVLIGRNPPYGRGIAFWALTEILRAAAGSGPEASAKDLSESLRERLEGLGAEDAEEVANDLAAAVGGTEARTAAEESIRGAWRRLVALLAAERPLIIGLDDAHWADDGVLSLIEDTAFRLEGVPVMIVCTARPELLERRPDFGRAARNVTQIELRPLSPDATAELAACLLPDRDPELARRVAGASGGNPFFAEEVARGVGDDGDGLAEHLPDTVQAAVSSRLDLLPAEEKCAIQYASVLGSSFEEGELAALIGRSPGDELAALARRALIRERVVDRPGQFSFRHQLIRDVAYASLPKAERAELHEAAAEAVTARAGSRQAELAELVAFHLGQANDLAPTEARRVAARDATLMAADAVFRRGASARSQELYEHAATLALDAEGRIAALREAASVAIRRFRGDEAVRLLRAAAAVAEDSDLPGEAAAAYAMAVEVACRMAGVTGFLPRNEILSMLERGSSLAEHADPVAQGRLILNQAWFAWWDNRNDDLGAPAEQGLQIARKLGDAPLLSSALDAASASAWAYGRFNEARRLAFERLEILEQLPPGDPTLEMERSDALHMVVETLTHTARYQEALEHASRAREGDLSRGVVYSGWTREMLPAYYAGHWDEVVDMGQKMREAWKASGSPVSHFLAGAVATAGAVLGLRGDEDHFREWMDFAQSMAGSSGQTLGVKVFRAEVALHRGLADEALAILEVEPDTFSFWWKGLRLAMSAEAAVLAGNQDAAAIIDEATPAVAEIPLGRSIVERARGIQEDDGAALASALATFVRIGCPYQVARTRWLMGGAERAAAGELFAQLGAAPAGEPG